ncbi:hypothetical protein SFC79_12300 [Nocardioides sp. S-58]|uniref:PH domain-containing protein n=1 Tax=Nocardioides renjunii TaxID=3095075 RepID=A0ABU5KCE6_9ACTN|nr:hypothetical protein [Nocardioides sp. S-58]MDZ5662546.1 hypothetical protein [Nocardioides sp. S-58]
MVTGTARLIPRWYAVTVVTVLTLFTLGLAAATAAFADDLAGRSMWGLVACAALVLVAAVSSLLRPRRRREPEVTADGTRVFRAPALTVWPLVLGWFALLATAAVWGWVALTDFDALESPGFSIVAIVGALASLPDLVRLLTGRLHRWTLELGPEAVTYRGYRTDATVPWKDVKGAAVQERGPAGVRIDLRGGGTDPVVPITAFDVPAEQLVDEIVRARKGARR